MVCCNSWIQFPVTRLDVITAFSSFMYWLCCFLIKLRKQSPSFPSPCSIETVQTVFEIIFPQRNLFSPTHYLKWTFTACNTMLKSHFHSQGSFLTITPKGSKNKISASRLESWFLVVQQTATLLPWYTNKYLCSENGVYMFTSLKLWLRVQNR